MDKHLYKRIPANNGKHFLCQFPQDLCSWIIIFVHAMSKTTELSFPGEILELRELERREESEIEKSNVIQTKYQLITVQIL